MRLVVDITAGEVRLDALRLGGQWLSFYGLLAAQAGQEGGAFLVIDDLHAHAPWDTKARGSVGKEVARHLTMLAQRGLGDAVQTHRRTRSWALGKVDAVLLPSREAVAVWLATKRRAREIDLDWLQLLIWNIDATVPEYEPVAPPPPAGALDAGLERWQVALLGRAAVAADDPEAVDALIERTAAWLDPLGAAAHSRLVTARAFLSRFDDAQGGIDSLDRLRARRTGGEDTLSAAHVDQLRALLLRRLGRVAEAASLYHSVLPVFGVFEDHLGVRAGALGLALCASRVEAPAIPLALCLDVVEAALRLSRRFGLTGRSVQAELLAARWSARCGRDESAVRWIEESESLVRRRESDFDVGVFHLARAELVAAGLISGHAERDAKLAEAAFLRTDDQAAARRVRERLVLGEFASRRR